MIFNLSHKFNFGVIVGIMANLENQYLKEEMIDDDYVLVDFEDLPEKKSSARNSSQEVDFDNLPEKQGLVRNISGENIYDAVCYTRLLHYL